MPEELRFVTPLSVDECLERIARLRSRPPLHDWYAWVTRSWVYASIRGRKVVFRGQPAPRPITPLMHVVPQNSIQRLFYARLVEVPDGTRIVGRFRVHPFLLAGMTVWAGALLALGVWIAASGDLRGDRVIVLGFIPVMLAAGWGMERLALSQSARGEALVLAYLRDELGARREDEPAFGT